MEHKLIWDQLSYDQKLAATMFIFEKLNEHAEGEGSFRYLIYDRLGFGVDAYADLYNCGGLNISNYFKIPKVASA